jgi:hypothetical protein
VPEDPGPCRALIVVRGTCSESLWSPGAIAPVWWNIDGNATSLHGQRELWLLTVRKTTGWQIAQVDPYP